ncbi:RNA polymerase sigma factor RpoH [Tepidiphilus margaritifer]|uniref:RNA polymerase sigma factor RpoH n=1 Tax=Tepidiphilus margaritifer TaxID=203471 RepID=UPI0004228CE4|nr:RNA polymerase sigma factor RpoH [Tepidiphilus margaritifer]
MTRNAVVPLGYAPGLPSPVSSLEQYVRAVRSIPPLSAEEEKELARRWRLERDLEAARRLVLAHLRYVVAIARQYFGYGLPEADLIQEGNVGLMKAVRRFDETRGVRLVTFAVHWIKAEIHEFIVRNWRLVKIATTKAQRKLFFNLRRLKGSSNALQPAEARAIADELGVKPEEVLEMEARFAGAEVPLEAPTGESEEDALPAPIAYLPDPGATPEEAVLEAEAHWLADEGLRAALSKLDARSADIVRRRWLAEEPETLQALAAEYGVSAERIRQIEAAAIKKLRAWLTQAAGAGVPAHA